MQWLIVNDKFFVFSYITSHLYIGFVCFLLKRYDRNEIDTKYTPLKSLFVLLIILSLRWTEKHYESKQKLDTEWQVRRRSKWEENLISKTRFVQSLFGWWFFSHCISKSWRFRYSQPYLKYVKLSLSQLDTFGLKY